MKKLLTVILTILTLSLHSAPITPPDGKMTLYFDDGSKKIEKEYKYGQPFGTWTKWYDNEEIWGTIVFENTALPDYKYTSNIVKIELRYSDEDNTIRFKGEQFAHKLIDTENNDGSPLVMPVWDFISNSYDEKGKPLENDFVVELEDELTGNVYHFPSLYWQGLIDDKGNAISD